MCFSGQAAASSSSGEDATGQGCEVVSVADWSTDLEEYAFPLHFNFSIWLHW